MERYGVATGATHFTTFACLFDFNYPCELGSIFLFSFSRTFSLHGVIFHPFPFISYSFLSLPIDSFTISSIPSPSTSFHFTFFPYLSFVILSFHFLHLIFPGSPSPSISLFPSLPVAEKGKIVNGRLVSGADRYTTSIDEYPADAFRFYPSTECL